MWKEMLAMKTGEDHPGTIRVARAAEVLTGVIKDVQDGKRLRRQNYGMCCTCQRGPPGPVGEPGADGSFFIHFDNYQENGKQ
ncbi:unnamed protein product [Gongylonema pulchrum]|uniref:DnaJ_C domain-containing protein n=1 Tax=Gongylonema pulchrum TaxID=637853 RepID=A0A183DIL3_9BILA|nr:unnamed protein product [Gongylonema pulchrum]